MPLKSAIFCSASNGNHGLVRLDYKLLHTDVAFITTTYYENKEYIY